MTKIFLLLAVTLFGVGFYAVPTHAAGEPSLYFKTTRESFAPGSEFVIGVFLNSGVPVNAVQAEIGFSTNVVEWLGSNTVHSLIRVWKDSPRRSADGTLVLEGGTPIPFTGRAGELIELYFRVRPDAPQPIQISLRSGSVFLADGSGSEVPLERSSLTLSVTTGVPAEMLPTIREDIPPAISFFKVIEEPVLGRPLAVWESSDGESGIAVQEVSELLWFSWRPWVTAMSPVGVHPSAWGVRVSVTDRVGNRTKAVLYRWDVFSKKAGVALGALVLTTLLGVFITRRRRRVS